MDENPADDVSKRMAALTEVLRKELKTQQDPLYAVVGGLAAALVSALCWAIVTALTRHQIGYMAVGVGVLVGFSVRLFGAGIDRYYGFIGSAFALLGCVLGNLFAQIFFISSSEQISYFDVIALLNLDLIIEIYKESFSPVDVLFYGIAAYGGYKIALRNLDEELATAVSRGSVPPPAFARFRLPVVIVLFIGLSVFTVVVGGDSDAIRTFNYESGSKRTSGALANGVETGYWESWWENGNLQSQGIYVEGQPDSTWTYYDEEGKLSKQLTFRLGIEYGPATEYFDDGTVAAKGQYKDGRLHGEWTYFQPTGEVLSRGSFYLDQQDGEWEYYYSNGQLSSKGGFDAGEQIGLWVAWTEAGQKTEEIDYDKDGNPRILNTWDVNGKSIISRGSGKYEAYYDGGALKESGSIKDGFRYGEWKSFYETGKRRTEGEYRDKLFRLLNAWDEDGKQIVTAGEGIFSGLVDNSSTKEKGYVGAGLRSGLWVTYFPESDAVMLEINYVDGKLEGSHKSYYLDGQLRSEGNMSNGQRVGDWTWYAEDGVVESTANFVEGKKEGVQSFYDSNGELTRTETYSNGKLVEPSSGS